VSTSLPSTLPANATLARPGPIEPATSATETGWANSRREPAGGAIEITGIRVRASVGAGKLKAPRGHLRMGKPRGVSELAGGSVHVARSAGASARATSVGATGPAAPRNSRERGAASQRRQGGRLLAPKREKKNGRGRPGRFRNILVGGTGFEPVTPTMSR